MVVCQEINDLPSTQARTEALQIGIEKARLSAYRIEVYGTLTAHPLRKCFDVRRASDRGRGTGWRRFRPNLEVFRKLSQLALSSASANADWPILAFCPTPNLVL